MLDRVAGLARLALNRADQLIDVAAEVLQLVVRQLTPLTPQLAFNFVPIALQCLCVD